VTDKLYFNGINARTGTYGLEPMTPADLARQILADQRHHAERLQALEAELRRHIGSEAKLLALVDLLVQSNLDALEGVVASPDAWAREVARKVLGVLLGSHDALPGEVDQFTHRLAERPRETLRMVASMLGRNQERSLARLLVGGESDATLLRVSLERRLDQAISRVQRHYLSEVSEAVDADGVLRASWIASLQVALDRLPVPSLQAQVGTEPIKASTRRLVAELSRPEPGVTIAEARPVRWVAPLVELNSDDSPALWHRIVTALARALFTLHHEGAVVSWQGLRGMLRAWLSMLRRSLTGQLGVVPWVDPRALEETGWGIIFPAVMPPEVCRAIQAALDPLLALRREQAGSYFRRYEGKDGYRPGDTARAFMGRAPRFVEVANPANPPETGVPYYLLLVGGPEAIPFDFQYQLDVQYAVGRLDFGSDLDAYASYARNVVAAEAAGFTHTRRAVFFGVNNPNDQATARSRRYLVDPLHRRLTTLTAGEGWQMLNVASEHATKANLSRILSLSPPPAVLFAAGHGVELEPGDDAQSSLQGALLCRDWDGTPGELTPAAYFSAGDVTPEHDLRGLIVFLFACYSAGTPRWDEYGRWRLRGEGRVIAPSPFVAALPRAMLALKDRGALAVIGHVERAWNMSFMGEMRYRPEGMKERRREHIDVFACAFERLLRGYPVGAAMDFFNVRYAAVATELTSMVDRIAVNAPSRADVYRLAELWTTTYDARGYVVLGDPAVRLQGLPALSEESK
jgi:hypothetical protein